MQAALLDGASIIPIIGLPPITTNDPERYVDRIFDEVLQTFSRPDTLTCSLQDWRKGRRAEIDEVNGYAVGHSAQAWPRSPDQSARHRNRVRYRKGEVRSRSEKRAGAHRMSRRGAFIGAAPRTEALRRRAAP
jgi:2-dehydropantoate 2-reductase